MNTQYHLLSSVNYMFHENKVKSLVAYKIAAYIILELLKDEDYEGEFFFALESMSELAELLRGVDYLPKYRSRTTIKSALDGLEKSSVLCYDQMLPDYDLLKSGEFKEKKYLTLFMPVKSLLKISLLDDYRRELTNITHFNDIQLKLITCLNLLTSHRNLSLLAYQLALFFISLIDDGDIERKGFIRWYKTNKELSKDLTPFIRLNVDILVDEEGSDKYLIDEGTIDASLETLSEHGFIEFWRESPSEYDGVTGYKTKMYLMIEIDFNGLKEELERLQI